MNLKPTLAPLIPVTGVSDQVQKMATQLSEDERRKLLLKSQLQRNRIVNQPWSVHSRATSINRIQDVAAEAPKSSSLPTDFKANVASLPPIQIKREVNVQSLAVDLDFVKTKKQDLKLSNL